MPAHNGIGLNDVPNPGPFGHLSEGNLTFENANGIKLDELLVGTALRIASSQAPNGANGFDHLDPPHKDLRRSIP